MDPILVILVLGLIAYVLVFIGAFFALHEACNESMNEARTREMLHRRMKLVKNRRF